jgi:hypothetical protein
MRVSILKKATELRRGPDGISPQNSPLILAAKLYEAPLQVFRDQQGFTIANACRDVVKTAPAIRYWLIWWRVIPTDSFKLNMKLFPVSWQKLHDSKRILCRKWLVCIAIFQGQRWYA